MRAKLLCLIAIVTALTTVTAEGETPRQKIVEEANKQHKPIYFGEGDNLGEEEQMQLIRQFYENQFRQFSDPMAPYFMLMSRDGKLAMGVGGVFSLRERYEWHGTQTGNDFIPYNISHNVSPTAQRAFSTSVGGTKIFATVIGKTRNWGYFKVYIEGKFNATKSFVLGKAYATLADWTVGYANTTFSDALAQPATIDSEGPNSMIDNTNVLVRWIHTFNNHYVVAASMETPSSMIPESPTYQGCSDYMPSFAAFGQYQWEGTNQHIRLSGIVRGLEYRNLETAANHKTIGWGAQLSTVFNPVHDLTVFGAVQGGKGISDLVNDLQNAPLDMAPVMTEPGVLHNASEIGWYAAMQYSWNPKMYSTLIFSQQRYLPGHKSETADTYRYGYYATANLFYHPIPRATLGIEYNYGYRKNYDMLSGHQNRIQVMFEFNF